MARRSYWPNGRNTKSARSMGGGGGGRELRAALLNTALRLLACRVHFPAGTQEMGIGKEKGGQGEGRPEVC